MITYLKSTVDGFKKDSVDWIFIDEVSTIKSFLMKWKGKKQFKILK
jgi:hypothetical protein